MHIYMGGHILNNSLSVPSQSTEEEEEDKLNEVKENVKILSL